MSLSHLSNDKMSRILPLPPEAISGIQSSKHITSLQDVVLSLLENSLDAESNKVEVSVDFRRGCCTIEDNGTGIPLREFLEGGGLGHMYHTSKHLASNKGDVHGSTGAYLASLGALSLLTITSKMESKDAATLSIHQGQAIARHIPAPQSHDLALSSEYGTRVTVRDLFGNMPVRVKQRAFAAESGNDDEKAWQQLKHGIVALLLAWSKPCSVKIHDVNLEDRYLHLSAYHPAVNNTLTEKSLNQLGGRKAKFDLKDALAVLFQASFAPAESRVKWVPLSAASSTICVKGCICLDPAPTKSCQFVSLGIHPCKAKEGFADLYEAVNRVFSNSRFGALEDEPADTDDETKDRRTRDRRFKQDGFTKKQMQARKGVDRWPMFVLKIKFKDQIERGDRLSERSLRAVGDILEAAVREWLAANHFRPRKNSQRKAKNGEQSPGSISSPGGSGRATPADATPRTKRISSTESTSTSKKRKIVDLSSRPDTADLDLTSGTRPMSADFSTWSRIKSGRHSFYEEIWEEKKPDTARVGRVASITEPTPLNRRAFELPPLEAGELSLKKKTLDPNTSTALRSHALLTREVISHGQDFSSEDFGSIDSDAMLAAANEVENDTGQSVTNDALVDWTDPNTKQTYTVNSRTGVVLPSRPRSHAGHEDRATFQDTPSRTCAAINTSLTSAGLPLTLSKRPLTREGENSKQWLPGFLKQWNNPVFVRQDEEAIPIASFDGPGIELQEATNKRCTHAASTHYFDREGEAGTRKLSKAALRKASVVRQVDRKFILCKVQEDADEILVLVDQHAASERVILEGLLEELCTPVEDSVRTTTGSNVNTVGLEKPIRIHVPATEFELFRTHAQHFADWGIIYYLHQKNGELSASQIRPANQEHIITVKSLPPGIAERCTLFPKLLIELLRSEIWTLQPSNKRSAQVSRNSDLTFDSTAIDTNEVAPHSWLYRIGTCPKGILDLLNSRACRSAIMFNDELSVEQCEDLLRDLSRCAFPFMCAHGRVSMVPLAELGADGSAEDRTGLPGACEAGSENNGGFAESFKRWKGLESNIDRNEKVS